MVYNQTLTIWALPPQPLLPVNDIRDPIVVTIWLVVCFIAAFYLRNLLRRKKNPTWQEFRAVRYGTLCLAVWYLARATDRWLRYDQRTSIPYGYALAEPVYEILRVTSTILILWGTYTVVWRELEDQFSPRQQGIWWFAARFLLFIVTLMTIFYIVLGIALVAVWLEFLSLNAIADIAGKRNDFEMVMTAFFVLFALLTLVEATVAWFHAFRIHGQVQRTRLFMWLGALFLFVRSTSELAIVNDLYKFHATRQNMKFTSDVSYGFITMLYLAMMCAMAHVAASSFDSGGRQANMVASDVRRYIINMLEDITNGGRTQPPPFETVLREVERNLESALSRGPLTGTLGMDRTYKEAAALDCIEQLRTEFGRIGLKEGDQPAPRRPSTLLILTSLCGRRSRQAKGKRSTTPLNTNTHRPKPPSTSAFTESTARSRPVPEQPRGYHPTPSIYSEVSNEAMAATPLLGNPIPATRPWPTPDINGPSRWTPSLDAFQEQPQPYQDISPLPVIQNDMPITASPGPPPPARTPVSTPGPPFLPTIPSISFSPVEQSVPPLPVDQTDMPIPTSPGSPPPARTPVSTPAPPLHPKTPSISLSPVEQSIPSTLPPLPVPITPSAMDSNNGTSQPVTTSSTFETANDASLIPYSRDGDFTSLASIIPPAEPSESRPPAQTSLKPLPTPPPNPGESSRTNDQDQVRMRFQPPTQIWTVPRYPPPPSNASPSSSTRISTSPQATPGSSYHSLQAQRLAGGGGGGGVSDPPSTASGSRTGYQIQPRLTLPSLPSKKPSPPTPVGVQTPPPHPRRKIFTAASFDGAGRGDSTPPRVGKHPSSSGNGSEKSDFSSADSTSHIRPQTTFTGLPPVIHQQDGSTLPPVIQPDGSSWQQLPQPRWQ